jgi:hypothetical protein
MLCDSFNDELQRLSTGDMLMEVQIVSSIILMGLGYFITHLVLYKLKETKEWKQRDNRKKEIDKWGIK